MVISAAGGMKKSFRGIENNYINGFNLNMFQSSTNEGTPIRKPSMNEEEESTIMKRALVVIAKISTESVPRDIIVHTNTFQINSIVQKLGLNGRLCPWTEDRPSIVNMIGWHQFSTSLPKGFHEGSDEAKLSLYKINEVVSRAIVMYPPEVYNFESENFEYKKKSFMRFIPHERNEHYKVFNKLDFYRSTVDSIPVYFQEYSRIQDDPSADEKDLDVFVFAIFYDFMSYVAQQLGGYLETGVSLQEGRKKLIDVI